MPLDSSRFLELQYNSLRKEIEIAKANMLKLIIGGSAVVPSVQYLADKYSIGEITLALPLVIVVLVLIFLAENHSMMRAGTYILTVIEPQTPDVLGWETWLNSASGDNGARTVDKLVIVAFSIVAASYFVASVILAARHALHEFGSKGQFVFVGIYLAIGISLTFVLYRNAQTDTRLDA